MPTIKIQLDSQKLKEKLNLQNGRDGLDGKDYILTETDKKQIAKSIKVPVVEKIIEKTEVIKEQPIITQEIKEVAKYEEPEQIVDKLNTLEEVLDYKVLKNIPEFTGKPNGGGWRNLFQLHDVSVPTPTNGQALIYNSTTKLWEAKTSTDTDEKVKYDASDPTAGYLGAKIIAGTGITLSEGTGADENKLKITSTITQYTDALAVSAIKADADWNASDWDTAFGWGNHASAGYLTSVTAHNLLSATHGDTLADSVASGDLLYGNATPKWARLAKGTDGKFLKLVSGLPSWESIPAGVSFGATTQIPHMNAGGTDFQYSAGNTFDGNSLMPSNLLLTPSALGDEKITNGDFVSTTGWTLNTGWSKAYVFTVSGITTSPAVSSTYTNNGVTYTTRYVSLDGTPKSGFLVMTGSGDPTASGNLTKASGTGDATVAFSAFAKDKVFHITSGTGTLTQASASMVTPLVVGELYTLSFDVVNRISTGTITVTVGGQTLMVTGADDTYKQTFRAKTTGALTFTPSNAGRFGIDNVSLKKADGMIEGAGLLLTGTTGGVMASGAGTRLMWIPELSAFRAGTVTGTQWDYQNIGQYSVAMGLNSIASGISSMAIGPTHNISGASSVGLGDTVTISADNSFGAGLSVAITGASSVGLGNDVTISSYAGIGIGNVTIVSGGTGNVAVGASIVSATLGQGVSVGGNTIYEGGYGATAVGISNFIGVEGDSGYGAGCTAVGYLVNITAEQYSTGVGYNLTVSANYATALGYGYTNSTADTLSIGLGQLDYLFKAGELVLGSGVAGQDFKMTFNGETNSGEFKWMEDEDYFEFSDTIKIDTLLKLNPTSAPGSPAEGDIYADSSDHHLYFYNGSAWKQLDN